MSLRSRVLPAILGAIAFASGSLRADPGDVDSSHDYPGFPRLTGFVITDYDEDNPADFDFPIAQPLPTDASHIEKVHVKGHRYVIRYEWGASSQDPSLFQTQQHYEKLAEASGFTLVKDGATGNQTETFRKVADGHECWIYLEPAVTVNVLTIVESTESIVTPSPGSMVAEAEPTKLPEPTKTPEPRLSLQPQIPIPAVPVDPDDTPLPKPTTIAKADDNSTPSQPKPEKPVDPYNNPPRPPPPLPKEVDTTVADNDPGDLLPKPTATDDTDNNPPSLPKPAASADSEETSPPPLPIPKRDEEPPPAPPKPKEPVVAVADHPRPANNLDDESLYNTLNDEGRVVLPVLFQPGRKDVDQSSQPLIKNVATMLQKHPDLSLQIEGHTDNSGTLDDSLHLSEQRALSVQKLLIAAHVDKKRLDVLGLGSEQPLASNATEEGRGKNRRIELVMWKKDPGFHAAAPNGNNYYPSPTNTASTER